MFLRLSGAMAWRTGEASGATTFPRTSCNGYKLANAFCAISLSKESITIRAFIVLKVVRRQGQGRHLVDALIFEFPQILSIVVLAIVPDELSPFFVSCGFLRD